MHKACFIMLIAIMVDAIHTVPGYVAIHHLIVECPFFPMRTAYGYNNKHLQLKNVYSIINSPYPIIVP